MICLPFCLATCGGPTPQGRSLVLLGRHRYDCQTCSWPCHLRKDRHVLGVTGKVSQNSIGGEGGSTFSYFCSHSQVHLQGAWYLVVLDVAILLTVHCILHTAHCTLDIRHQPDPQGRHRNRWGTDGVGLAGRAMGFLCVSRARDGGWVTAQIGASSQACEHGSGHARSGSGH